ncbi:TPA: NUDIX hydrolase [Candidatus Nomurabacteria bacterium]|nr:MAG: pyrophosphohydrolase [Parcubacteria bacterium RAAC4_OD1_1]HCY26560.1 NUDIX hydrolase [Candidatus Nomurabacteria bacterium]
MIYKEKPKDFTPDIEVVACLVEFDNKFILLHRQDNKIHGGKWGQPAGKVDPSDLNSFDAMVRELREETGIITQKENLIFYKTFFVSHPDRDFLYHYFVLHLKEKPEIVLSKNEHKDYLLVKAEEALCMNLIPDEDYCLKDYFGIK